MKLHFSNGLGFKKSYFSRFELLGSGSPKRDPVRFGFLKTQELRVKFRVGFGPNPALAAGSISLHSVENASQKIELYELSTSTHITYKLEYLKSAQ